MSPLLKLLLPLLVVLPLGAFVVGSLVSAAQDDPDPRTPIVLREGDSSTPASTPTDHPTDPTPPDDRATDEPDSDPDDDGHVVRPTPVEEDDDDGDDRDDGEGADDGDDD